MYSEIEFDDWARAERDEGSVFDEDSARMGWIAALEAQQAPRNICKEKSCAILCVGEYCNHHSWMAQQAPRQPQFQSWATEANGWTPCVEEQAPRQDALEIAVKALKEIADLEGAEDINDFGFVELALGIANRTILQLEQGDGGV